MIKKAFLLTLLLGCITCLVQAAEKVEYSGLWFELNNDKTAATLIATQDENPYTGNVIIPSSIFYEGVSIPVTALGYGPFKNCSGLKSVNMPTTIKSIGKDAFSGCTGLYTVEYYSLDHLYDITYANENSNPLSFARMLLINGQEVNQIAIDHDVPNFAFCQATWLKGVTFNHNVTSIGERAFYGCTALSEITFPKNITQIKKLAFRGCKFTSISLPENCQLGTDVFQNCKQLTSAVLPANMVIVPNNTFDGCTALTDITLPANVNTIGQYAFQNCNKLTIMPTSDVLESIEDGAFQGCSGFKSITLPPTVKYIWNKAFAGCTNLTDVYCLPTTPPIATDDAFGTLAPSLALHIAEDADDQVLTSYTTTSPWSTFRSIDRTRDSRIIFYINDEYYYSINQRAGTLVDASGLQNPTNGIFHGWDKEIPVFMPNDNLEIYGYVSYELIYDGIKYLLHPSEQLNGKNIVKRAEMITVDKELAATDIQIEVASSISYNGKDYPVIRIADNAFEGQTVIKTIIIPASVSNIGEAAFKGCSSLTTVQLPESITAVSASLFEDCSALTTMTLPDAITTIGNYAFRNCRKLTTLTYNQALAEIGNGVFKGCTSLTSMELPANCQLGTDIFQNCTLLETVTLPTNLTKIPAATFDGCFKLQNITLPVNIETIEKFAFRNCESLTLLPTTNKLKNIGEQAFKLCRGLTVITLPASIETIGANAFDGCSELTDVYCLSPNVPTAESTAFGTLASSLALHIAEQASSVLLASYKATAPWSTFASIDATRQSCIYFYVNDENYYRIAQRGGTLTDSSYLPTPTIGKFSGWDKEIPVFMPNNDLRIFGYVSNELIFDGIKYLLHPSEQLNGKNLAKRAEMINIEKELTSDDTQIDIAASIKFNNEYYPVTSIAAQAFKGQTVIQTITIPTTVSTIGEAAFKDCSSLTTIQLPDVVTVVSDSLFENCIALTTLTLPNGVTTIGKCAFRNCMQLSAFPISTTLKEIGEEAFANCTSLTTLVMNDMTNLETIRKNAFKSCTNVFSLTLPLNLETLEQGVFSNCPLLADVFCFAETAPAADATTFGGNQQNMRLYVPKDHLASYQAQEPWKSFSQINENGEFTLAFYVNDASWYKTTQMGGTQIEQALIVTPTNGIFSGWDKAIPLIMPGNNLNIYGYLSQQQEIGDFQYHLFPAEQLNGKNLAKRAIVLKLVKKPNENTTTLQVPEEVTYEDLTYPVIQIADNVFEGCNHLERIILPVGITAIGNAAFKGCSSLKVVSNFPTSLETLGDNLFMDCKAMTQFTLSEHVKNIGKQTFSGCTNLKDIQLPAGLKTIGYQAFAGTAIEQIVLPASITTMAEEVFKQCRSLRQATFAEGFVLALPKLTFWNCQSLEKVTLQGTMVDIQEAAFQGCTKFTAFAIPEGIINLGSKVFKDCSSLATVTLPATLDVIGRECFSGCPLISQLTVNSTEAPSANVDAFEQEVYSYAYLYVPSIEAYQGEPWKYFRKKNVAQDYVLSYVVDGEPYKQISLRVGTLIDPEQYPVKEGHRFSGWLQLPTIMPAKDLTINGNFQYQIRYYENEVDEANRLMADELHAYYYGDIVTLPVDDLKRDNHWYVITGITEEPISEEEAATFQMPMPAHDINVVVTYHKSEDEMVLYGVTYKILVLKKYAEVVTADKSVEEVVIPDAITYEDEVFPVQHIQANAFKDCTKLKRVKLPTGLLTIGEQAFYNCGVLTTATLPSQLQRIDKQAFARTSLSEVTLPASLTEMDKEVFVWCTKLKTVDFQATITSVPNRTFQNCVSLPTIVLPEQITAIGDGVFEGCSTLKDVALPEHLTTIGEGAFKDCSAITDITLPASVETIGDKAFINVLGEGDVITLQGTILPDAVKGTFDNTAYEQALLRTKVQDLTGPCWPLFQNVKLLDPAGIASLHADQLSSDAPVYDLNGRQVAPAGSTIRLPKGIYIQHGIKIAVK